MLTKEGFKRPNYAEIQEDMNQRAKELFGEDVNLSERSPIGIFNRLFSWFLAKMYELAEKVYNSGFISKAEGVQLDRLTAYFNTSRNPEQYATAVLTITGTAGAVIPEGTRFETVDGVDFALTQNVTLTGGTGSGIAVSLNAGVIGNVGIGTIVVQSEPSANITSVTNAGAATGGREVESDTELLARLRRSSGSAGSGTPDAIISDVLAVEGVRAANIIVNAEPTTQNGIPAHSNAVYVLGGVGQTIAEALFKNYVGMRFFGSSSHTVKDISGNSHTIAFTPATQVSIFSNVTLTTDSSFPSNGVTQVKDAITRYIGGVTSDGTNYVGLNMGDDVIYSKVLASVLSIQGVTDATLTIGKAAGTQAASNIAISVSEVAQINTQNNIVVTA